MPRTASPDVRRMLIERAAGLLSQRRPVTLRSLVEGTGASTMAVYTHFDGMPGLWRAVRAEGFERLGRRIAAVRPGRDPVEHLASLGVAYVEHALREPDLYRVMFDAAFDLPEPDAAAATFEPLVVATQQAQASGRFDAEPSALDIAFRYWASGHGVTSLAVTGVLAPAELRRHAPQLAVAVFVAAGDDPEQAQRSVTAAWHGVDLGGAPPPSA